MRQEVTRLLGEVERFDETQLQAALTVYAWNAAEFLDEKEDVEGEFFRDVYKTVLNQQSSYRADQLNRPLAETDLPTGLADAAARGEFESEALADPSIRHEWTIHPGADLFETTFGAFEAAICGDDGVKGKFERGELGQADFPVLVVTMLLSNGFSEDTVWVPLAVSLTMLLVKRGMSDVCASITDDSTPTVDSDIDNDVPDRIQIHSEQHPTVDIDRLESRMSTFESELNHHDRRYHDLRTTIDELTEDIMRLRDDVDTLLQDEDETIVDIERIQSDLSALESEVERVWTEMSDLEHRMAEIEDNQKSLRDDLRTLQETVEDLQDRQGLFF